jgi:hypothetical protein
MVSTVVIVVTGIARLVVVLVVRAMVKVMATPVIIPSIVMWPVAVIFSYVRLIPRDVMLISGYVVLISRSWVIVVPTGRSIVLVMMVVRKISSIPAIAIIIMTGCPAIIVSLHNCISATIRPGIRIVGMLLGMMCACIQQ